LKDLRLMWKEGVATFGPFVQLPWPGIPEILAHAGWDFFIIDLEHGPIDIETAENMVRAGDAAGITPIVRVLRSTPYLIAQALNTGAIGVHVPHISTKEEAEEAAISTRFHPLGERGVCPFVRAARYSADKASYYQRANAETILILAIEGTEGIENLEKILTVKGIDSIFVGPYDLSQSLGVPGQVKHDRVIEKIREICETSRKAGVAVGLFVETAEDARFWVEQGIRYCCLDVDAAIFYKAAKTYMDRLKKT